MAIHLKKTHQIENVERITIYNGNILVVIIVVVLHYAEYLYMR